MNIVSVVISSSSLTFIEESGETYCTQFYIGVLEGFEVDDVINSPKGLGCVAFLRSPESKILIVTLYEDDKRILVNNLMAFPKIFDGNEDQRLIELPDGTKAYSITPIEYEGFCSKILEPFGWSQVKTSGKNLIAWEQWWDKPLHPNQDGRVQIVLKDEDPVAA